MRKISDVLSSHRNSGKLAPKNSYIHVEDFENLQKLVDYIHYLDRNDTAYMEYHQWRIKETFDPNAEIPLTRVGRKLCRVCQVIKQKTESGFPKSRVESMVHWWWGQSQLDDKCLDGKLDFLRKKEN